MSHPLAAVLDAAARGRFPRPDGTLAVLPAPPGASMAVVGFTAHHVVAADVAPEWVRAELPGDDLSAPMSARFLVALGEGIGRAPGSLDVVLAARGLSGDPELAEVSGAEHPRVARAHRYRSGVRVFEIGDGAAVVVVGYGLALRREVAVEVDPAGRNRGIGAAALLQARRLVAEDDVLYAQVAPGNAASLRAFLRAGFEPIGCEVLFL
ncbi:MAG TPA: GNAT family protein [Gaiellales bacterium]|nr:GNAT family protein [Gaiellales bacterium]